MELSWFVQPQLLSMWIVQRDIVTTRFPPVLSNKRSVDPCSVLFQCTFFSFVIISSVLDLKEVCRVLYQVVCFFYGTAGVPLDSMTTSLFTVSTGCVRGSVCCVLSCCL